MAEKPWKKAIEEVLRSSGSSMSRTEIADEIVSRGLRRKVGATPANTVVANISTSLRDEGKKSPFVRVGRGEYALREVVAQTQSRDARKQAESDEESEIGRAHV